MAIEPIALPQPAKIDRVQTHHAIGRGLRRSSCLAQAAIEVALAKAELSLAQWSTLRVVKDAGEITLGDLAREIEMTSGAMTRLIDGLEARGLARRDRTSADRRLVKIVLTDAAEAALASVGPVITTVWTKVLQDFSAAEISQLAALLAKLVTVLERQTADNSAFLMESMS